MLALPFRSEALHADGAIRINGHRRQPTAATALNPHRTLLAAILSVEQWRARALVSWTFRSREGDFCVIAESAATVRPFPFLQSRSSAFSTCALLRRFSRGGGGLHFTCSAWCKITWEETRSSPRRSIGTRIVSEKKTTHTGARPKLKYWNGISMFLLHLAGLLG